MAGKTFDVGCVVDVVVVEVVDGVSEGGAVVEDAASVDTAEELPAPGLGARSDSGLGEVEVVVVSSVFLVVFRDLRSFFGLAALLSAEGVISIGVAVAAGTDSVLLEAAGTFGTEAEEEGDDVWLEVDVPVGADVGAVVAGVAGFESDSSFHKDSSEPSWSSATAGNMHAWLIVDARSINVAATRTALFRTEISLII